MKLCVYALVALLIHSASCMWLDTNNLTTIQQDTAIIAHGLMSYYEGDQYGKPIGMFTWPYYWWEAGGAWGSLIDYSFYMQNDTYVPVIKEALVYQSGDNSNYMPLNQTVTEGNDDQAFWGIATMAAAEKNFSNPHEDDKGWLALTQAVFNTMSSRWDAKGCGGGIRWQIFKWNSGYDYKNSVSNGALFHLAARLARYTANDSYVDWAEKIWDWMYDTKLIAEGSYWSVYDGIQIENCSQVTKLQWTYNHGLMMAGCAYLWNYTGDELWLNRTANLVNGAQVFFYQEDEHGDHGIMYERACQPTNSPHYTCNEDQRSFKAFFCRFLSLTAMLAPESDISGIIYQWLVGSANAAARSCSGGLDGVTCGLNWLNQTGWDGVYGLGEQMSALEAIQNVQAFNRPPPYTARDGGTSKGNPAGGYALPQTGTPPLKLDSGDKAGAGIITAIIGIGIISCGIWLVM